VREPHWSASLIPPPDAHAKAPLDSVPENLLHEGSVRLMVLQLSTARRFVIELPLNGEVVEGPSGWQIRALGAVMHLRWRNGAWEEDASAPENPAAVIELARDGKRIYRGWMFASFPELFGPSLRDWKFWIESIKIRRASDEAAHP